MHQGSDFYVSIVTFHEVMNGWLKFLSNAKLTDGVVRGYERLEFLLGQFSRAMVLPFDNRAAAVFDGFRRDRIRVATMDLRIASIAVANRMTVLTSNTVHFEKVPNLIMEDWIH